MPTANIMIAITTGSATSIGSPASNG
jgi:hypothetical protein